ncbi:MAG TPA: carboxypeptidase regulatory-like domain-containing protein, partial [Steroidobacteraceae bacterium]|nr:carboxypeptidase regulatory-like domain-containing protein [Steroidobacteraceae bacterium]
MTVTDTSGVSVNDADVQATVGSASKSGSTDAAGVVLLSGVNVGTASVAVSRSTFVSQTVSATITADQTTDLAVQLVR